MNNLYGDQKNSLEIDFISQGSGALKRLGYEYSSKSLFKAISNKQLVVSSVTKKI